MPEPDDELNVKETIGWVLNIAVRRRWFILVSFCAVPLAAIAFVLWLPDRYTSDATLVVIHQQVSQRYVEPTMTMTPTSALDSLSREILSRTRLLGIIDEFHLYADPQHEPQVPELLVERMRKDVKIEPLGVTQNGDLTAFTISFTARTAELAQKVASRLASLFIEENLKQQGMQAESTTNFLNAQLEAAKAKMADQEQRLQLFRMRNLGELPEQQQANLSALTDLRMQLQNASANLDRAQQQQTSLGSQINSALNRLQTERAALLGRFTPRHPDVVKKDQEIAGFKALLKGLNGGAVVGDGPQDSALSDDPLYTQIKAQVDANSAELSRLSKAEQRLRSQADQYQRRLSLTPVRDQELANILRDYNLYKQNYTDLLTKQLQSQLSANLASRQEGRQFRLVDPPTLPLRPSSPKRLKLSLGGVAAGIALGIALAFLVDIWRRSFHSEKEVALRFALPLVVGVPLFKTPKEERIRKWMLALQWVAGSVMILAVCVAEFYVYRHG